MPVNTSSCPVVNRLKSLGIQVGVAVIKRFKPTTLKLAFGLYFSLKFVAAYFGLSIWQA
jgi:hypothetical protein